MPLRMLSFVLAAGLLAGCVSTPVTAPKPSPTASTPPAPVGHRNVYTQDKDSAPAVARNIDYHAIPDAVPRREPRGKYGNKSPYTVLGKTYEVMADARGYRETGGASWYGEKFQGFRTSSMEPYDMYAMTAAHKTLPIPSYVRVTNHANNRSVVVRVNDRGPFHEGRIIDLSWAAAQKLGYANVGTARVTVEAIDPDSTVVVAASGDNSRSDWRGFCVQVGAWSQESSAQRQASDTRGLLAGDGEVAIDRGGDGLLRVRAGPYADRPAAERVRDRLREAGIDDAVVLALP